MTNNSLNDDFSKYKPRFQISKNFPTCRAHEVNQHLIDLSHFDKVYFKVLEYECKTK